MALRDRLAAIERETLRINEEIVKLDTYIDVERMFEMERLSLPISGTNDGAPSVHHRETSQDEEPPPMLDERFHHKSYKSATCLVLEIEGRPMSISDVTEKLIEAGIDFVAADRGRSVFFALAAAARDG